MHKSSIGAIIERLGYSNSLKLVYCDQISASKIFSTHMTKILQEISPYAVYVIDSMPFVLFFEEDINSEKFKKISKQIWNAQIPISIVCGENTVKIFNSSSIDKSTQSLSMVLEQSINNCNEHSPFSYWEISNANFWSSYTKQYSQVKLNEVLLENISYLTEKLKNTYQISFATKLVLRIIFIRYLIDRGVDLDYDKITPDIEKSKIELLNILKDKDSLYALFAHLKKKFNGNLFDLGEEIHDPSLVADAFVLIANFLSGKEYMPDGQKALFELYDFNIIPVELISNIYEILLGKQVQSEDNAFYTPNYLVDYILDKTIAPHLQNQASCIVLDPACGSGIFLVNSYRRMVENNLGNILFSDNDAMLVETLKNNIYGIDVNEDAIDVAIFSLYLTVLDYKDPKTLKQFTLPNLRGTNLFVNDFFDENKLEFLKKIKFDFIIGNPPWGSVKTGFHMKYCEDHGYKKYQQNAEISRSFVFRSKDFSNDNTQCCFILHSKLLYNQKGPAKKFRKYLLSDTIINRIIEMSSVRKLIFKHAKAPAVIVVFKYSQKDNSKNRITYISLKPNIFFKLFNIIVIEKNDIKFVEQNLLFKYDWAWKTIVFGLTGDIDLIIKLKEKYSTIKTALRRNSGLVCGTGVEYNDGDKKDASHLMGLPMLDSKKGVGHFYVNSNNTTTFNKEQIHRPRDEKLFIPPYCITAKGLDCSDFTMKSVYSEDKFICRDTMYIIKGTDNQKSFLLNLAGLFNSTFFAYLNLMLGSSVGIEREQRFMEDVFYFPYIHSEDIADKVEHIQKLKTDLSFGSSANIKKEIECLNNLILDKYSVSENIFVDYALNIQIPQLTGSLNAKLYSNAGRKGLLEYSKCFEEYFSLVYEKSGKHIAITIYPQVAKRYAIFELTICDNPPLEKITIKETVDNNVELLSRFSVFKTNDMFYQIRDVAYFQESSFFIIKPNHYKNWHPAIAKLDLIDVIDQILSKDRGDQ